MPPDLRIWRSGLPSLPFSYGSWLSGRTRSLMYAHVQNR